MNPFSLEGKTALIVGASRGIGLAIAQHTAAAGARTILAARSVDRLETNTADLKALGYDAHWIMLDIADPESIRAAVEEAGPVDILVNVAGTNIRKPFEEYTKDEYESLLRINLHGIVVGLSLTGALLATLPIVVGVAGGRLPEGTPLCVSSDTYSDCVPRRTYSKPCRSARPGDSGKIGSRRSSA